MAVQFGGPAGRFLHRSSQSPGKILLTSPVKAQSAAGQENAGPASKASEIIIYRLFDLRTDLIQFAANDRFNLFSGKSGAFLSVRTRNLIGLTGGLNPIYEFAFNIFRGTQGNVQFFRQGNCNITAADIQHLVIDNRITLNADDLRIQISHINQHGSMIAFLFVQVEHCFAGRRRIETGDYDSQIRHPVGHIINKEAVSYAETDECGHFPAFHANRFQGLFSAVDHKPCRAGMHDYTGDIGQVLSCLAERVFHIR